MTCALCRRPPGVGLLCYRHSDGLGEMLDPANTGSVFDPARPDDPRVLPSIPALYRWLDAQHGRGGDQLHSGVFRSVPPGRLGVMALRDPRTRTDGVGADDPERRPPPSVPTVLGELVARVDRTDVDGRLEARPDPGVQEACSWLHVRREWLAGQSWIEDTWASLRALHGALRGAWGDPAMAPVGTCRQLVDDDGHLCAAGPWRCAFPLYLPEQPPKAPDEPVTLPSLRCASCGWTYHGVELVRLGREREAALNEMRAAG